MKSSRKELALPFECLEFAGYFSPCVLSLLNSYLLHYHRTALPFFFVIHVLVTLADLYSPRYVKNHSPEDQRTRMKDPRFLLPIYSFLLVYLLEFFVIFNFFDFAIRNFSYPKLTLTMLMVWLTQGELVVIGHELGHRKSCIHRFFGYCSYLRFLNTSFIINHNKGHHKWVATPNDPASAVKGQTVFQFARKSIPGSFWQGWEVERERIAKQHGKVSPVMGVLLNQVFLMKLGELLYLLVVYWVWGTKVLWAAIVLGLLL